MHKITKPIAVHREKFITVKAYTKKDESIQITNLTLLFTKLEKENHDKHKANRGRK